MLSFRDKFILLLVLLLGLALGGAYWLIRSNLEQNLTSLIKQDLSRSRQMLNHLLEEQYTILSRVAGHLSHDPEILSLFPSVAMTREFSSTERRSSTLQTLHSPSISAPLDVVLVMDPEGKLLFSQGENGGLAREVARHAFFLSVFQGNTRSEWIYQPERVSQILGRPLFHQGKVIGGLFVGQVLDNETLKKYRAMLDMEVVLLKDEKIWLSTELHCPYTPKDKLLQELRHELSADMEKSASFSLPGYEIYGLLSNCFAYLSQSATGAQPPYVLLKSAEQHFTLSRRLHWGLLLLGVVTLLLAGFLTWLFNRNISIMMGHLQTALEQVERENYRFRIPNKGKDEFATLGESFNQMLKGLEEKERLRVAMEQIVSRDLALELLRGELNLRGEMCEGSVLYADIQGFSALSHDFTPGELLEFLNNYFTRMSFCIEAREGMIDRYQGDALLAVFGIPVSRDDHAKVGVQAAQDILEALDLFNLEIAEAKDARIKLGIGISSGALVAGNLGAEHRFNYSIIGEAVNVAERLQGLTKHYGVPIIISESTYTLIQKGQEGTQVLFHCRELDFVRLDNRSQGMSIYEVLSRARLRQETQLQHLLKRYQEARRLLMQQNFSQALEAFEQLHGDWPEDRPTTVMLYRCRRYASDPHAYQRENPQGVYTLTTTAYT